MNKSQRKISSRRQIAIRGVRDGILILPGHQYRIALSLTSVNFELKSEAEQDALLETYQSFLNSLACPLQILVRIRKLDIDKYIEGFKARLKEETEDIYKLEIRHYTDFVRSLIASNNILARHFYVIIPYSSKDADFDIAKEQLILNSDIVAKGLARLGIHSSYLSSLDMLDLFYSFYNPGEVKSQPITNQTMALLQGHYL